MKLLRATLSEQARKAYAPLAVPLRELGRKYVDDADEVLAEAIEEKFQEELVAHVCRPLHVNDGACLIGAIVVARNLDPMINIV